MSANNPVFNVLIPTGDQAVLAAGNNVDALAVGQIGVFSAETNLSLNAATIVRERAIYLAVGLDTDADAVQDDIRVSAGNEIQKGGLIGYNLKCYSPAQSHIVDITNITNINCDTAYSIKLEFRGNTQALMNFGSNQFAKPFSIKTDCCGPSCDCPDGDCNAMIGQLIDAINADEDGLVTAEYLDYTNVNPALWAVVAPAGVAAWITANPGLCLGIRLTTVPSAINTYCNIPLKYYKLSNWKVIPTVLEPICDSVITVQQEPAYAEGAGSDIGFLEYDAGGHEGEPGIYRVGESLGTAFDGFQRQSTNAGIYNQLNLYYEQKSVGGWKNYESRLNTVVAVPCTGTNVTLTALTTVLDAYFTQFDALTDDVGQCADCGTTEFTSDIDNVAQDGLG